MRHKSRMKCTGMDLARWADAARVCSRPSMPSSRSADQPLKLRMTLDKHLHVRALRHHAPALGLGKRQTRAHEFFRDAVAAQLRRYKRVREDDPAVLENIVGYRQLTVQR